MFFLQFVLATNAENVSNRNEYLYKTELYFTCGLLHHFDHNEQLDLAVEFEEIAEKIIETMFGSLKRRIILSKAFTSKWMGDVAGGFTTSLIANNRRKNLKSLQFSHNFNN